MDLLRKVACAVAGGNHNLARLGLQLLVDDFQQGGFASAILPHQPDAVAVANHKRHILEQEIPCEIDR